MGHGCCIVTESIEQSIPWFRGMQSSGLASDVDGEVQIDGGRLIVDGAGTEVELADGLDDTCVNERAARLNDLDVLGLALFIDSEGELDLGVRGNEVEREAHGKRG